MTLAQDITRAFNGDWHGSYGTIPTPGHSPKDRGTTVRDNDNGDDVVLSSFNGGDWKAIKDECRRRGLLRDRDQPANDSSAWRETGVYEYVGADGAVAYRTVRKEKSGERKRFVAQRPDGRGGWVNGLDRDGERILYRLPDILAADPATVVYLTEGERKADKLASWGLVATAVAFGARGWRGSYAAALAGRTVAILPDNDDEGRGFADMAAASITAAGGRAVIVTLPDLPPKGDVIDWSGDADTLRLLTVAALNPPVETIQLLDPSAWAREETPSRTWALHEMILVGQVTYLTGAGASGKSLLGQQLATCIATGMPSLGWRCWKAARSTSPARMTRTNCTDARKPSAAPLACRSAPYLAGCTSRRWQARSATSWRRSTRWAAWRRLRHGSACATGRSRHGRRSSCSTT